MHSKAAAEFWAHVHQEMSVLKASMCDRTASSGSVANGLQGFDGRPQPFGRGREMLCGEHHPHLHSLLGRGQVDTTTLSLPYSPSPPLGFAPSMFPWMPMPSPSGSSASNSVDDGDVASPRRSVSPKKLLARQRYQRYNSSEKGRARAEKFRVKKDLTRLGSSAPLLPPSANGGNATHLEQ